MDTNTKNHTLDSSMMVKVKKRGRPKKPNMITIQVRMDLGMDERLESFSRELGIGKSQAIALALKSFFDKAEKRYRLIEE